MKSFDPKLLRRHCFVWFAEAGNLFDRAVGETPQDDLAILRKWIGKERPLIVRRPCVSEDNHTVCVGLALPPDPVKRRSAFRLPVSCIGKIAVPPLWQECMTATASDTAHAVSSILSAAVASGLPLRTFGSYAWQYHTSLPYVTSSSDIDLLVPIQRRDDWRRFRQAMAEAKIGARQIDLEIILNDDASFNWREFEAPGSQMLFKGNRSVWLGDKSDVEELLHE
jgi:phosphoribosyl-dephospho-CoA transferase